VNPKPHFRVDFDRRLKLEFHGLTTYEVMESVLNNMRILEPQCLPMNAAWKSPNLGIQAVHATRQIAILGSTTVTAAANNRPNGSKPLQ
jgi:hypothetical protein